MKKKKWELAAMTAVTAFLMLGLRRRSRRSFAPPFPPSRPQAIPAAADFLFGTFSFVRW